MSSEIQPEILAPARWRRWAAIGWTVAFVVFAAPLVLQSLALQSMQTSATDAETTLLLRRSTLLVLASLLVTTLTTAVLAIYWNRVVRRIGNAGLATIAMMAGMQFSVAYAARLIGSLAGALLGPFYIFVDGVGSKGLTCLVLGALVALLPLPGVMALELITVFVLNAITTGTLGLVALLFIAITIALHESLAVALGVTIGRDRPALGETSASLTRVTWSFAIRVGLTIGLAQCLSLLAQYEMSMALFRLHFDVWYKVSVSVITGLVFGGVGATCGAFLGGRLRRVAP